MAWGSRSPITGPGRVPRTLAGELQPDDAPVVGVLHPPDLAERAHTRWASSTVVWCLSSRYPATSQIVGPRGAPDWARLVRWNVLPVGGSDLIDDR